MLNKNTNPENSITRTQTHSLLMPLYHFENKRTETIFIKYMAHNTHSNPFCFSPFHLITPSLTMPKQRRTKLVRLSLSSTAAPLMTMNPPQSIALLPCRSPPRATIKVVYLLSSLYFSWTYPLNLPSSVMVCGLRLFDG